MAVIQDMVLTFCPTMHSVQQRKLKLLMPVFYRPWENMKINKGKGSYAMKNMSALCPLISR